MMISPTSVVSGLWLVWLFGWLLASGWTARTIARQSPTSQLAYSVFIWLGAAVLFFHLTLGGILEGTFLPSSTWIAWGGVVLVVMGLGFASWARLFLGQFWSGAVTLKEEHALVRTGPYALTRHPIYTGLLLALIGTALVRGTFASLLGLFLLMLGLMLKIRQEERLLIAHFGDAYRAYQAEVPGVVPWPGNRAA
jgi:protein-S-isoprenylcysteine O-methyltransferase Ste14